MTTGAQEARRADAHSPDRTTGDLTVRTPRTTAVDDHGFTLIELLIVITVLGILATIVLVATGSTKKDAVASSCKTNFKSIQLSAESVFTKGGGYPSVSS